MNLEQWLLTVPLSKSGKPRHIILSDAAIALIEAIPKKKTAYPGFFPAMPRASCMKELAGQADTGTYDSTQRLMIESEYQAMAGEITRIANATDFNGVRLLDGTLSGMHDGSGLESTGEMKIHFGSANSSAEDYYYVRIGNCTAAALGMGNAVTQVWPPGYQLRDPATGFATPVKKLDRPVFTIDGKSGETVNGAEMEKIFEVATATGGTVQVAHVVETDKGWVNTKTGTVIGFGQAPLTPATDTDGNPLYVDKSKYNIMVSL